MNFVSRVAIRLLYIMASETQIALFRTIKPRSRVTILVSNGIGRNGVEYKEATGTAVIVSPDTVALNMGGRYGSPGVATPDNIVAVHGIRIK